MKITDLIPWRSSGDRRPARSAPTDPVGMLQLEVDRAFDRFWRVVPYPFESLGSRPVAEAVRVDVEDTGEAVTVTAELPGLDENDVDIAIGGGQLVIRGEKKADRKLEEDGVLVKERFYGALERTVPLPDGVDPDAATAQFRNGVLTITLPKSTAAQAETRHIPVQAG